MDSLEIKYFEDKEGMFDNSLPDGAVVYHKRLKLLGIYVGALNEIWSIGEYKMAQRFHASYIDKEWVPVPEGSVITLTVPDGHIIQSEK